MKLTDEEKGLLERLNSGELDGRVGRDLMTSGGSTIWTRIKDGVPARLKQGPSERIFDGKENTRYSGVLHVLEEWITDEDKNEFLRKFGWLIKDAAVKSYSSKFKPKK